MELHKWFIFILTVTQLEASKILAIFPTPVLSHQLPFRPLVQELATRGHKITVITTDPAFSTSQALANLKEIDVHNISYEVWKTEFPKISTGKKADQKSTLSGAFEILNIIMQKQLQQKEIKEIIDGHRKFDLIIIEALSKSALAFRHRLKVPIIAVSSFGAFFWNYDALGAPSHALFYPSMFSQRVYGLSFLEKLNEIYRKYSMDSFHIQYEKTETETMRKYFGHDMPSLKELNNDVDMLVLNYHHILEGNNPLPLNVIRMWGIQKSQNEIPQDLMSYNDSSKHGIIYFSFGSTFDPVNLSKATLQTMLNVLSKMPYEVLFKWNYDFLPECPKNFRISKWYPQTDILRHPKLKLFITQGGLHSTEEAIIAGVPFIGIPLLGDQWYNMEKYVHFGIGVQLATESITEDNFKSAIENVIKNNSYRTNIRKLRDLLQDEPLPPLERAVWWVEYVLRHGGARHLRAPAANISWTQYFELELILTVILILLIVLFILMIVFYKCYFYCFTAIRTSSKISFKQKKK